MSCKLQYQLRKRKRRRRRRRRRVSESSYTSSTIAHFLLIREWAVNQLIMDCSRQLGCVQCLSLPVLYITQWVSLTASYLSHYPHSHHHYPHNHCVPTLTVTTTITVTITTLIITPAPCVHPSQSLPPPPPPPSQSPQHHVPTLTLTVVLCQHSSPTQWKWLLCTDQLDMAWLDVNMADSDWRATHTHTTAWENTYQIPSLQVCWYASSHAKKKDKNEKPDKRKIRWGVVAHLFSIKANFVNAHLRTGLKLEWIRLFDEYILVSRW